MCNIVVREGTASLVVITAIAEKISQDNERGARNSPTAGRGLSGLSYPLLAGWRDLSVKRQIF